MTFSKIPEISTLCDPTGATEFHGKDHLSIRYGYDLRTGGISFL
jgi:hypothetical protein